MVRNVVFPVITWSEPVVEGMLEADKLPGFLDHLSAAFRNSDHRNLVEDRSCYFAGHCSPADSPAEEHIPAGHIQHRSLDWATLVACKCCCSSTGLSLLHFVSPSFVSVKTNTTTRPMELGVKGQRESISRYTSPCAGFWSSKCNAYQGS